jgi:uncharacterized membrane-anchored protein YhcB (DUF1043 family)
MDILNLAFDWTIRPWQWILIGVAAAVIIGGLVVRQIQRKKAGL